VWWLLACLAAAGLIFWWVKLGRPRRASARPLPVSAPASEAQPRSSVAARARSAKEPARWIAPGEAVSIGGITITSGMIYVGGAASTAMHGDPDNCVVDPRLPLGENVDRPGGAMPPWPSYGGIQPRERRTYLEWLAGGRCDPEIGIGYVFLFFYGLERRYFIEGARQEHRALADEVRRLLEIHGRHGAFRGHARRFLDALDVLHATDQHPALSPQPAAGYDISLLARRRLGRKLAHGEPLAAEDALTWHLALPDTRLRPSIARCFDAFVALWTLGFAERYPAGLKVSAPPIPLKLSYRAASGAFGGGVDILVDGAPVPDIAAVRASLGGLRDLADACTEALEPYARLLARNPALRDTPEAVVLLPPELAGPDRNAVVGAMRDRLGVMLNGHKVAQLGVAELFDILALPVPGHGVLGSAQRSQVSTLLDLLDIGFEPDPRYGSGAPVGEGRVLLFRAEGGAPVEWEKPAYRSAKCMCEVVVLAAPAGGPPAGEAYAAVSAELRHVSGLDTAERMRLLVYLGFLFADAPRWAAARSKLSSLPENLRLQVARAATGALLPNGQASVAGEMLIGQIHAALHLPVGASADPYAGVTAAEDPAPNGSTMAGAAQARSGGSDDPQAAARHRQDAVEVSQLLAGLFAAEAVPAGASCASDPGGDGAPPYAGLDRRHGQFLAALLAEGSMPREDVEALARSLRLLPDGACEIINAWGLAALGEAVIDGEDPIRVLDPARMQLDIPEHAA